MIPSQAPNPGTCLPWWHAMVAAASNIKISSGCGVAGEDGKIRCSPETMRAHTANWLATMGWKGTLTLDTYSLARHMSSEAGTSGSPEEKMLLALSTIKRARMRKVTPTNLLTCSTTSAKMPTCGFYGPIHMPGPICDKYGFPRDSGGKHCSPYGRWAATSADPTMQDILVATIALSGKADDFLRGADDQVGMEILQARFNPTWYIHDEASSHNYWVGHIPGINPMRVFLFMYRPDINPGSPQGQTLQQNAIAMNMDPRTQAWLNNNKLTDVPWNFATVCADVKPPKTKRPVLAIVLTALSVATIGGLIVYEKKRTGSINIEKWWNWFKPRRYR